VTHAGLKGKNNLAPKVLTVNRNKVDQRIVSFNNFYN